MKRHILTLMATVALLTATAQKPILLTGLKQGTDTRVSVSNIKVTPTDGKTFVTMDFLLDQLDVPSNRYRAFTPIVVGKDGQQQRLKTLIVSGRTQDIVFQRDGIDPLYADNYDKVRRLKGQPQTYAYADAVEPQPWHQGADIRVECDLCGCGDQMKSELAALGSFLPADPYSLISLTDAVPAPGKGPYKLHGSAYITFVVDRWEMKPDYMNNRSELRKITDTLDIMVRDQNVTVSQIKIHGWASPESPYEHNKMLATNRAKSLTEWVRAQYNLPADVFAPAEATPENWIGLRKAVEEANSQVLPHKAEILAIIDDPALKEDPKEWKLKSTYPDEYRYLLKNVYPGLRRSDYDITFNVRNFTLEEAKEVYRQRPYQLSLRELWDVANTYPKYSDDYNRVIQTAVNCYPDAPEALVNLANVAIRQRDLLKAETLLERAGNGPEAEAARGTVALLKGDYQQAAQRLAAAQQQGLNVQKNLDALNILQGR